MRSTLTDLDVLPRVYLFLRSGNFTSRGTNKYVHSKLRKPSYVKFILHGLYLILHKSISCRFNGGDSVTGQMFFGVNFKKKIQASTTGYLWPSALT